MDEAPVTAATGALGPVIAKLAALLGSEYRLRWRTQRDVQFIKSKFKSIHSVLWRIWEREDFDAASKDLKKEALDLADDMDDAIDDFMLSMLRSLDSKRFIQMKIKVSPFEDLKRRVNEVWGRCRKWKKKTAQPICSLFSRKKATVRAHPFVRKDLSELVGMEEPRDKLISHLVEEEGSTLLQPQLKMASVVGIAGMGKTTLANLVYEGIGDKFQSRAFVSLTPCRTMKEVLRSILEQLGAIPLTCNEARSEKHLINTILNFLKDKRYLVIIDDIWHWGEWEIIRKSLPQNNLGSRIVTTTCINAIAQKWEGYSDALLHKMDLEWEIIHGRWVYKIGTENVGAQMIAMKTDMVGEGFDCNHPIVRMCGGMPLAVLCMLSAVAQEREKQAQQGVNSETHDVQDKIWEQVERNGIQNTPGFEPLVESLQLCYDHLPHHMLKTCLLYCSLYPDKRYFLIPYLVRRWIAEGFVYQEEAATGYFEELVNRGWILMASDHQYYYDDYGMHPMMRNFLRWRSREDNFITWSSDVPPPYTRRIRRLCIESWPSKDAVEQVDPLSALDWSHIRSLVVYGDAKIVPFGKLERLRVLDLQSEEAWGLLDHHLKDICGLVCLRHLVGLHGTGFTEMPPEIGRLQRLETLEVTETQINQIPGEIGNLQQLKTLDVTHNRRLEVLPREIGGLRQLKTLDMSYTCIHDLPKEIRKLQHLEQLLVSNTRLATIPREIVGMKKLKVFKINGSFVRLPLEVCQISKPEQLPDCIDQAWKKSDLVASLAEEILFFQTSSWVQKEEGGLVVASKHMHVPQWIREHFNDLALLDIRICKLDEQDLRILREMPHLQELSLRFERVQSEPTSISNQGFARLWYLLVDSRVPRVTFQEGAMPELRSLEFQFQFYDGPPNAGPVGINHLRSLWNIEFKCNDWYRGASHSPCISATIDVVRKEAQQHCNWIAFRASGRGYETFLENKSAQISESSSSLTAEQ